jgi:pyruvate decarboxylase
MSSVIQRLISDLESDKLEFVPYQRKPEMRTVPKELMTIFPPESITHEYLWPSLSSWLKPHDIVLTESGTANLGIWDTKLPSKVTCISQTLWGSIGFALPAAQSVATAAREMNSQRVILFVGDGSFQVTAQALGTMIANKLNIIIFLINNSGYTMERWVHGMEAHYNDIPNWRYTDVPLAFGGSEKTVKIYSVNTKTKLEALLADKLFQAGKGIHFVDMRMPKEDAPLTLRMLCTSAAKFNAGHVK